MTTTTPTTPALRDLVTDPVFGKLAHALLKLGFSQTYVIPHNVRRNGRLVLKKVPDLNRQDFLWLCNYVAHTIADHNRNGKRAQRFCISRTGEDYDLQAGTPPTGFNHVKVTVWNLVTGSRFYFGYDVVEQPKKDD